MLTDLHLKLSIHIQYITLLIRNCGEFLKQIYQSFFRVCGGPVSELLLLVYCTCLAAVIASQAEGVEDKVPTAEQYEGHTAHLRAQTLTFALLMYSTTDFNITQ